MQVLESLGGTLYACLDYGLCTSEERALSAPLEHLISTLADLEDQPDASPAASEATSATANEDGNGARLAAVAPSSSSSTSLSTSAQGIYRRLSTIDEAHETSQSAAPSPPPELSSRQNSRPAADGDEGIHDCYNPEPDADLVRSLLQVRLSVYKLYTSNVHVLYFTLSALLCLVEYTLRLYCVSLNKFDSTCSILCLKFFFLHISIITILQHTALPFYSIDF